MDHQDVIANLEPEQVKAYESLIDMVNSDGFDWFKKDCEQMLAEAQGTVSNASSWESYKYAQGFVHAMGLVVNLESRIESDFAAVAADTASGEAVEDAELVVEQDFL